MSVVRIRHMGQQPYQAVYDDMLAFIANRDTTTTDELWFLQHSPVFTQGQAGKAEHVLFAGDIPVVQTDRGGQVTYHGPGQLVVYLLMDIARKGMGPRHLVTAIEQALVDTLASYAITAAARPDAPGVYVEARKIASLGLRIKQGRSFHGLALNVDMDLSPFQRINPCGYAGMEMTQVVQETAQFDSFENLSRRLQQALCEQLALTEDSSNSAPVGASE